jgi:hypothetical protein
MLTLSCISASAQSLRISLLVEKTVAGLQYGSLVSFQTNSNWGFGGFYQFGMVKNEKVLKTYDPFIGLFCNAPLVRSEKIIFYAHTRVGFVNRHFFVFVPGVETEIKLFRWLSLSAVMSMRMSYPSAGARLNLTL